MGKVLENTARSIPTLPQRYNREGGAFPSGSPVTRYQSLLER